jgi:hypothetical protein
MAYLNFLQKQTEETKVNYKANWNVTKKIVQKHQQVHGLELAVYYKRMRMVDR